MSLERALRPLWNAIRQAVVRVELRHVDDGGAFQQHQVDGIADDTLDDLEHFGLYGFQSRPKPGAEGIMLAVGGVHSHGVIIATHDRRYRLKGLADGDVALADDQGQVVHLGRNGISIVTAQALDIQADGAMTIQAASLAITGDTTITGKLTVSDDVTLQGDLDLTGDAILGTGATKFVKLADDSAATKVKAK